MFIKKGYRSQGKDPFVEIIAYVMFFTVRSNRWEDPILDQKALKLVQNMTGDNTISLDDLVIATMFCRTILIAKGSRALFLLESEGAFKQLGRDLKNAGKNRHERKTAIKAYRKSVQRTTIHIHCPKDAQKREWNEIKSGLTKLKKRSRGGNLF